MTDLSDHVQAFWKPVGWSSFDVIRKLRTATGVRKIGHAGTLDPFAEGILVICFGRATKRVSEMVEFDKEYVGEVFLGSETDTLDRTGKVVQTVAVPPLDEAVIDATLQSFSGAIDQVPPMYSALKRGGRRLYEIARNGETVTLYPRPVQIESIRLISWSPPDTFTMHAVVGKGTYIRSLARDIAIALETVGHLKSLTRLRVGPFDRKSAIEMGKLDQWTPIAA